MNMIIKHNERVSIGDMIKYQYLHWIKKGKYRSLRTRQGDYSLRGYDNLRCIFIHIPKTGGVSVSKALFGNLGGGHNTVRDYKVIFGPLTFARYFSFTFVRNPFSRLYSAFSFLKKGGFNNRDLEWSQDNIGNVNTFEQFVME